MIWRVVRTSPLIDSDAALVILQVSGLSTTCRTDDTRQRASVTAAAEAVSGSGVGEAEALFLSESVFVPRRLLKIIAAANHVSGSVALEIDALSFQNNGQPHEMADDAIIPVAGVFVGVGVGGGESSDG